MTKIEHFRAYVLDNWGYLCRIALGSLDKADVDIADISALTFRLREYIGEEGEVIRQTIQVGFEYSGERSTVSYMIPIMPREVKQYLMAYLLPPGKSAIIISAPSAHQAAVRRAGKSQARS